MKKQSVYVFIPVIIILIVLTACSPDPSPATGLVLEQHPLIGSPQVEPMQFNPMEGNMEDILRTHAEERNNYLVQQTTFLEGKTVLEAVLDGKPLIAEQFYLDGGRDGFVTINQAGKEVYQINTGPGSPITSLAGLWVVNDSWWLETVLINLDGEPFTTGQISRDGDLLNTIMNNQDSFGLQTIAGIPFYFFKRDGKIGYWYEGKEIMLEYDDIPHYLCCSNSILNPRASENMVSFFARSGNDWFYVELGLFSK